MSTNREGSSSSEAIRAAREFVEGYRQAVTRLDARALGKYWATPCLMLLATGAAWWNTDASLREAFEGLTLRLREAGFTHADFELEGADVIDDSFVAISVQWRLMAGATLIEHLVTRYVLVPRRGRWLAQTMTEQRIEGDEPGAAVADSSLASGILGFLEGYRRAFCTLEPETVAEYWRAPTLAVGIESAQLCATRDEVVQAFQCSLPPLRLRGLTDVRPLVRSIGSSGRNTCELAVEWELVGERQEVFQRLRNVYLLSRQRDAWQVSAVYLP